MLIKLEIRETFLFEDLKNEGKLEIKQLRPLCEKLGIQFTEKEYLLFEKAIDPGETKDFSYEALEAAVFPKLALFTKEGFAKEMKLFDFDKDGYIPVEDFELGMINFSDLSEKEIQQIVQKAAGDPIDVNSLADKIVKLEQIQDV